MNDPSAELAIVIPAFKARHFDAAMASLASQRDKRFTVYVGDDASSASLKEIVDRYAGQIAVVYHRFEQNLGGKSLVAQWHRCIALTSEPWIWLFADDDVAAPECVSAFYQAKDQGEPIDLYRFNLTFIDEDGQEVLRPAAHPAFETPQQLLVEILTNRVRQWRAPDHIFSREVFERHGGFQEFPAALFSDSATWIKFAHPRGVRTIEGPHLFWRNHSGSVSMQTTAYREAYLGAFEQFCGWVTEWIAKEFPGEAAKLRRMLRHWFFMQVSLLCGVLSADEEKRMRKMTRVLWPEQNTLVAFGFVGLSLRPWLRSQPAVARILTWRQELRLRHHTRSMQGRVGSDQTGASA